ncbi:hypothetical protein QO008_001117 [Peptoniphilus ivorii]|uniref:DUF2922 domain-containing protein n=1 Tax=Aedoeadaptatus ivorii TaxID=54006 RepID=UPI00278301CF|nr:DUF2922 domain-containing protein [Peptoniphilus ivorii]MDQ0508658.1 hypothetical protein [Peptoniphilus ivorii]
MEKTYLNMSFADADDKSMTLRVDDPKADLTAEDVTTAVNAIIQSEVFRDRAALVRHKKAEIFTVSSRVILNQEEA